MYFNEVVITIPIYKRCGRCGTRLPTGTECKCSSKRYKHEAIYVDDKYKQFYLSKEWAKKRAKVAMLYHQLDIYDLYVNQIIRHGRTLHHIVPLKEDWNKRLEDTNLIYLTDSNHQIIHDIMRRGEKERQEVIDMLIGLVTRYRAEYGVGGI